MAFDSVKNIQWTFDSEAENKKKDDERERPFKQSRKITALLGYFGLHTRNDELQPM